MSPPSHLSDALRGREGESQRLWLQSVFDRYQRPLLAYACRLLNRDTEAAQDCVQETFLALCQQPRSAVEGHVDAWLFKTCRNRAMDVHRRENRMQQSIQSGLVCTRSEATVDPMTGLARSEEQKLVEEQIQRLSIRQQELLTLRLAHGMSYKQIAEITGLTPSNVGFILHQALVQLKSAMTTQ